jgi:transposase-like protein
MSTKKLSITKSQNKRRTIRHFSEAFKKEKVQLILEKKVTVYQISDLYKVSRTSVYNWIYKYSQLSPQTITVVQMESEEQKTKILLNRVAELERIVGQKQLELDLNIKVFEYAKEELGYDIKKKYEQLSSNGSV